MARSTKVVRIPKDAVTLAKSWADKLGVAPGLVIGEAVQLQGTIIAYLQQTGRTRDGLNIGADKLMRAFGEAILAHAIPPVGPGIATEVEAMIERRARELARQALPHHVAAAVKHLCAANGLPEPPIRVIEGVLEIGDPPPGVTAPTAKRMEA